MIITPEKATDLGNGWWLYEHAREEPFVLGRDVWNQGIRVQVYKGQLHVDCRTAGGWIGWKMRATSIPMSVLLRLIQATERGPSLSVTPEGMYVLQDLIRNPPPSPLWISEVMDEVLPTDPESEERIDQMVARSTVSKGQRPLKEKP